MSLVAHNRSQACNSSLLGEHAKQSTLANLSERQINTLMNLKPFQVQQLQDELREQQETLRVLSELT